MYYNTFIVKSMSDFMTNNNSNSSIIQRFWKMLTIKQGLQNSSRKHWKKKLRKVFNKIPTFFSCYIVLPCNHTAPKLLLLSKNSTFYQSIIFSWTFLNPIFWIHTGARLIFWSNNWIWIKMWILPFLRYFEGKIWILCAKIQKYIFVTNIGLLP